MKSIFLFLTVFILSFSAMGDECFERLLSGDEQKFKAKTAYTSGEDLFSLAYAEIHKDEPNMVEVCNNLDLSAQSFEDSKNYYNAGFDYYKSATEVCEDDRYIVATEGLNICDAEAANSQGSVDAVNVVFEDYCSQ